VIEDGGKDVMKRVALIFLVLCAGSMARAEPDEDSWVMARRSLSGKAQMVLHLDGPIWLRSPLGRRFVAWLLSGLRSQDREALEDALRTVKSTCGIDLERALADVTTISYDASGKDSIIFVSTPGFDVARLPECLHAKQLSAAAPDADGIIALHWKNRRLYLARRSAHVVAMIPDVADRKALLGLLGQQTLEPSSRLAAAIEHAPRESSLWSAITTQDRHLLYAFGGAELRDGRLSVDLHVICENPDIAVRLTPSFLQALHIVAGQKNTPPLVANVLNRIHMSTDGSVVRMTASFTEVELR